MSAAFHVGISRQLRVADGRSLMAPPALALLEGEGITYAYFDSHDGDMCCWPPNALAWTEESVLGNSIEDARGLVQLAHGELPASIVNRAVLERRGFQAKLHALQQR